jgi:ABC-2 type transport system ATP-binding protein
MKTLEYILEAINLTKKYRGVTALDNVNLKLERGRIYGFVGNNGAGKTTFMRIATGLSRPTSGEIRLFGAGDVKGIQQNRRRTGVIVEEPVYYKDMTARQNLIAQSMVQGKVDKRRIDELLDLVGLGNVKRRSMRNFSTGMKQRYGIAFALLGDPEFLILDEPLNGLDVEGMDQISFILRDLCEQKGMTILLSSHLLARLFQVATDYIFISYGKIVETITSDELVMRTAGSDLEDYFRKLMRRSAGTGGGKSA